MNESDQFLREYEQKITDRFLQTQYSLWNGLITFNALVIGAISILFALNPDTSKVYVLVLLALSSSSILLILWNYLRIKLMYIEIQRLDDFYQRNPPEEWERKKRNDVKRAKQQHFWMNIREWSAMALVIADLIILFFIIYAV